LDNYEKIFPLLLTLLLVTTNCLVYMMCYWWYHLWTIIFSTIRRATTIRYLQ